MIKIVEKTLPEKTPFASAVQLTLAKVFAMGVLRFCGFARFEWYRRWTGGDWWYCVYFCTFTEWQRPEEFHRTHIVEKSVSVMEVWG